MCNNIINLATPVNSTDAATKQYVDDVAQGLNIHDSCNAATTGTLATLSSGTVTYNNGTSGVGATLTTTGSYTTIDSVTLTDGMRILVKNEVTAANNGIYVRTSSTVLTRAADFNSVPEIEAGDFTFVTAGTVYDNTGWVQTSTVVTVGTDPIDWTQFSGAGTYTAGTGLTLTGSVFSINVAQPTITSVGTLTSLSVSGNGSFGNVSATTFTGALTGAATSATTAGTVTTNAQPNITSVGTLTSLSVTGNISANNVNAGNLLTANYSTAVITTAAQPNITSVGTLTSLGVSGTVTASAFTANTGVFTGNGSALTALNASNVSTGTLAQARLANASVTLGSTALTLGSTVTTVAGLTSVTSTTFVGALTGAATTAGTVTTNAQGNITSVGTLTSLAVTGQVTAANGVAGTTIAGQGWGVRVKAGAGDTQGILQFVNSAETTQWASLTATNDVMNLNAATVNASASFVAVGNITGANVRATSYNIRSVATAISAGGTVQANATALTKEMNIVSTVVSGAGVVLPTAVAGMVIIITNTSANSLLVYPASGGTINSLAANAAFTQVTTATLQFIAPTTTQWYTVGATYA